MNISQIVEGGISGIGDAAIKLRAAITGDLPPDQKVIIEQALLEIQSQALRTRADVIVAEAKSEGALPRSWRPITMLTFVFIIAWNYIIGPLISAIFNVSVTLPIPPDMWSLLKIGLGGYVVGRSGEKIAPHVATAVAALKRKKS